MENGRLAVRLPHPIRDLHMYYNGTVNNASPENDMTGAVMTDEEIHES